MRKKFNDNKQQYISLDAQNLLFYDNLEKRSKKLPCKERQYTNQLYSFGPTPQFASYRGAAAQPQPIISKEKNWKYNNKKAEKEEERDRLPTPLKIQQQGNKY